MNNILYQGELLWPGIAGNFFIVLAFAAAFYAAVMYWLSARSLEAPSLYRRLARIGFYMHAAAVAGIMLSLFYILFNHRYEYKYAWEHLNNAMPMKYILSCFWEGQEGSFLLWMIWHVILGILLMRWSRTWEPHVMAVVALVQFFLASMLLGVFVGEYQLGSNPFVLMREHPSNVGLPWTFNADYLQMDAFKDGKGLNPLLQNYWMTIHPPTLFLGFAATLIPFAYAIAGLWKGDLTGWIKPAIPWTFFGVMILGTGILMGGAWAYEALGFGGFWAWDPVENASLVPWLTLVASAHLMVIFRKKHTALFATFLLTIGSFILVLYSTFLTRSGVLGDSSVHSFVDSGILPQLLVYLLFFVALATALINRNRTWRMAYLLLSALLLVLSVYSVVHAHMDEASAEQAMIGDGTRVPVYSLIFLLASLAMLTHAYLRAFPNPEYEEALWSREFWIFIGALVLTISAIHITWETSKSVLNIFLKPFSGTLQSLHTATGWEWIKTLADHNLTAPKESERFYQFHRVQVPLAFILFLLVAFGQYLKYRQTDLKTFIRQLTWSFVPAFVLTALLFFLTPLGETDFPVVALIFACFFALLANAGYAWRILRGKLDVMGASIAHIGFAMLILGAVISTSQQYMISQNERGDISKLNNAFKNNEDMLLYAGDTLSMGPYFVHYTGSRTEGNRFYTRVEYFKKLPRTYKQGERVTYRGLVLYCTEDHTASENILDDIQDSTWSQELQGDKYRLSSPAWQNGVPGPYLFSLEPSILMSPKGNSREPSIRHTLSHDLYTYLKYAETEEPKADEEGYLKPHVHNMRGGDQVMVSHTMVSLEVIAPVVDTAEKRMRKLLDKDLAARAVLKLRNRGKEGLAEPLFIVRDSLVVPDVAVNEEFGLKFMIQNINPQDGTINLVIWEKKEVAKDFIILTATIFPQINVLWLGCIVMVIGTTMAIRHRIRLSRSKNATPAS